MTPAKLKRLRKVVDTASRGKKITVVPTRKPPTILMLGFVDYDHAVAVVKFIRAFDSVGVSALLDEIGKQKT